MKYFTVLGFLLSSAFSMAFSQSTRTIVPANSLKSGHPSTEVNPSTDKNISTDPSQTNFVQYVENKIDMGTNTSVENQTDDEKVILPIQAEGYTDPNYELNKKKSEDVTKQLEAYPAPEKSDEELILDLQNKIKAIKDGVVVDPVAVNKLPYYEEELHSLLNKKK